MKSHVESGDALFSTLLNSYTHNTQGQFDSAATGDFLDQGRALAEKYGRQSGSAV